MEDPKRTGDATSMGNWVPSVGGGGGVLSLAAAGVSSSDSSGCDQSRVGDDWSACASLNDTPVLGTKQARRAAVDGAVPNACTCTAKQKRKSDIICIIIVIAVVGFQSRGEGRAE
jgi:hypothetical protein